MAQVIMYEVERNTACRLTVGIGPAVERMGELSKSYFKAAQVADHDAALGINRISDRTDTPSSDDLVDKPGRFNFNGDILLAKFHYASRKDINALIEKYTQLLKENAVDSPLFHCFIMGEVVVAASKIVEELSGDIKQVLPFSMDHHTIEEIITSRETFYETLRAFFVAVIEFRDSRVAGRYQSVILKAKGCIDQHYRDLDVSLHIVADHGGISPKHLSAVFSQETGENFIEYLTQVRIEKAKQVLTNTAMKSADIASASGFNDAHYFSYIFKKNTGFSPKEYRTAFHKKPKLSPLVFFNQFVTNGVDYILLSAAAADGWDDALRAAQRAGVKVFLFAPMVSAPSTLYETAVVSDMAQEGKTAVNWLKYQNLAEYNVIHIQGVMGSDAQIGRTAALDAEFAAGTMKKVIQQTGNWSADEGKAIVQSVINAGTPFNGIYAENDDMAKGTLAALDAAGITHGVNGAVVIMGFDCNKWALRELLAGNWNYDGQCSPFQASVVDGMIKDLAAGKTPAQKKIISEEKGFDTRTITQSDVDKYGLSE